MAMDEADVQALIGLNAEKAKELVESAGGRFRIHSEDGATYPVPTASQPDRVNVNLEGGVVVSVTIG